MTIGERLKRIRKDKGMTAGELAAKVGVSRPTITRYEIGLITMSVDMVGKIADALHVSPLDIMGVNYAEEEPFGNDNIEVPNLGTVAGGIPVDAIEDRCNKFSITEALARTGQFATFEIKGNSMSPKINDGDTVLVKYQPMVDSGDVAIIYMNDFQVTCKKVFFLDDGKVKIQAYNEEVYGTKVFTKAELKEMNFRILGKVILVVRDNF